MTGNGGTEGLFALPPLADIRPANPLKPVTKMQQSRARREASILTVKNFKTSLVLCAATIHIALTASGSRGPYRKGSYPRFWLKQRKEVIRCLMVQQGGRLVSARSIMRSDFSIV